MQGCSNKLERNISDAFCVPYRFSLGAIPAAVAIDESGTVTGKDPLDIGVPEPASETTCDGVGGIETPSARPTEPPGTEASVDVATPISEKTPMASPDRSGVGNLDPEDLFTPADS